MISQPNHPWLPRKMVLGGLPWVAVLIRPVLDALLAAKEADAALSNPLLIAHQPATDLLFFIVLCLFLELGAQVAALLARNATFAVAVASKPVACHAAILQVAECNRVLATKSLPHLQC